MVIFYIRYLALAWRGMWPYRLAFCVLLVWAASAYGQSPGIIGTAAGTGSPGFAGDGGPASQAKLDTADNISAISNRVSVLIPLPSDTIPPAAPTEMAAFAVDGRVFLQWAANSVPDLAAYLLFREDDEQHISSVPRAQVPFSTTTFIDDEVPIGQTYFYRLAAIDSAGNQSPTSEVVQATLHLVPDHLSPNPPAMPTAEWIRGMIALHWVVNVEPDLSDYLVLRSEDNQFMLSDSLGWVSHASFADSAVAMETTYCYRLVARVYIFTDYRSKPPCCPVKWFC